MWKPTEFGPTEAIPDGRITKLEKRIEELESIIEEKEKDIRNLRKNIEEILILPVDNDSAESQIHSPFECAEYWPDNQDSMSTTCSGESSGYRPQVPPRNSDCGSIIPNRRYIPFKGSGDAPPHRDVLDIVGDAGGWPDDVADFLGV